MTLLMGGFSARAQLSQGGIPASFRSDLVGNAKIPLSTSPLPDWDKALQYERQSEAPAPYLLALFTPSDIRFPASGMLTETADGQRIWRAQMRVSGAKAIGLYYDQFRLPPGVKLYLYNSNEKQILGAYTASNNQASGKFANEAIQGETVNIELNIDPDVALSAIQLHINRFAVYFRGFEYLSAYSAELYEINDVDSALSGSSSVCMIDAVCPLGAGYEEQRDATLQQLLPISVGGQQGVAACSGTMINSVGNTPDNCKQYYITATHCEPSNSMASGNLDQLLLRFNFMRATCDSAGIPESNTMTGANFIARADFTASSATEIKGDFMLLELKDAIPESWGINLAGWNNDPAIPTQAVAPKKFIGFHHPNGDMKKVSASSAIESMDLGAPASHWATILATVEGLVSTGSSGSALFDSDGRVIGIASVAGPNNVPPACMFTAAGDSARGTADVVLYSKLSYDWDYSVDGSDNFRKLKPWLDPAATGVTILDGVTSDCSDLDDDGGTGITFAEETLDDAIHIYPNPVTGNQVNLQFNLQKKADMALSIYDISGKELKAWKLHAVRKGTYALDISGFAPGMYLLKVRTGKNNTEVSKKIMIQ